ncbi:hypothetical protein FBY35_5864 [Streptomyces sp. SLBN-118]|uniref:hypothetical protein n=1 Tax=Streptomyces sp. SLBN-118 TaxID=2768454 RepID=UPI001153252A|nr:hypothetical protein [Streptomyces sp. SLBN-118]TQK44362.1 hypothetical protein FBY35_5864 [Streptomyces sp. SLBN-118]
MPVDARVPLAVDDIRGRLADTDSVSVFLPRRELTKIWRRAEGLCLFESWKNDPRMTGEAEPPDEPRDVLAEWMKSQRARLSKGQAMELQLALEEAGIHCEPALGRLVSMTAVVRIYRRWRDPKRAA